MGGHRSFLARSLVAVMVVTSAACSASSGNSAGGQKLSVFRLRPGECFNDPEDTSKNIIDIPAVSCAGPHDKEVFAVVKHPAANGEPFPGSQRIEEFAEARCLEGFESYVGEPYSSSDLQIVTVRPIKESWERRNDRAVACVLYARGKTLTGSKKAG